MAQLTLLERKNVSDWIDEKARRVLKSPYFEHEGQAMQSAVSQCLTAAGIDRTDPRYRELSREIYARIRAIEY